MFRKGLYQECSGVCHVYHASRVRLFQMRGLEPISRPGTIQEQSENLLPHGEMTWWQKAALQFATFIGTHTHRMSAKFPQKFARHFFLSKCRHAGIFVSCCAPCPRHSPAVLLCLGEGGVFSVGWHGPLFFCLTEEGNEAGATCVEEACRQEAKEGRPRLFICAWFGTGVWV